MYIFKLSPSDSTYYDIDKNIVEYKTEKKYPYYRSRKDSDDFSQFAVCPACSNPIQIIGLYTAHKPYARHYKNNIPGLVEYLQENYDFCPLKRKHQSYSAKVRKQKVDSSVLAIIRVLIENFDKVIYFVQKSIDIYISVRLAKDMLNYYFTSKGYLYPGSTLLNVPLMFAYFSGTYHLNGRIIFSESLKESLKTKKFVSFSENKLHTHCDLSFCFRNHSISLIDEHNLQEKLIFSVAWRNEMGKIENVYEKEIEFDPIYCRRLFQYKPLNETEKQKEHRNMLRNSAFQIAQEFGFMVGESAL